MKIEFPKSVYKKDAIEAAIEAFSEVIQANLGSKRTVWQVDLTCLEPEYESIIVGEFANYCLAETAARRESGELDVIEEG